METQIVRLDEDSLIEKLVDEWNRITNTLENDTIKYCLLINTLREEVEEDKLKQILKKVSTHPRLRKSISTNRIWSGLRLIKSRPDLITYTNSSDEEKESLAKPVLKNDGTINYEFYLELYNYKLDEGVRFILEEKAKEEGWSYRRLIEEIRKAKDSNELLTDDKKVEKAKLIREIAGILRSKPIEYIRIVREYLNQNEQTVPESPSQI